MRRMPYLLPLLCLCLAVVAEPTTKAPPDPARPLVAHMHDHYQAISQVQAAIISGNLEAVREPAQWLAEHATPTAIPVAWYSHVEAMRAAARDASQAGDLAAAARAAATMAGTCGSCHSANNVYDQFPQREVPADDPDPTSHMQRHQWAADRMWEGLIGPSNEAWNDGTNLLLEVPMSSHELHTKDDANRTVRSMARRVHELAAHAMLEDDFSNRVTLYAEFLGSCAACHTHLGRGPRSD